MPNLFDPVDLGPLRLKNKNFMAPMTRSRAGEDGVLSKHAVKYYAQRVLQLVSLFLRLREYQRKQQALLIHQVFITMSRSRHGKTSLVLFMIRTVKFSASFGMSVEFLMSLYSHKEKNLSHLQQFVPRPKHSLLMDLKILQSHAL